MAGVKGKSGRKKLYEVEVWALVTKDQATYLASLAPQQSEAVRILIDRARTADIHAQSGIKTPPTRL